MARALGFVRGEQLSSRRDGVRPDRADEPVATVRQDAKRIGGGIEPADPRRVGEAG